MPELLSPVGTLSNLYAAVNNGCNAVYLGGKQFNARGNAENFSESGLTQAIDYCHLRGVKVFITVNTLYKQDELQDVFAFMNAAYQSGADAFIFQDIGTAMFAKKHFPRIAIHASTQMTAHSLEDVLFLKEQGFDRVVLSRELSLDEIQNITANAEVETEMFVHGALCYSFSGQCLMSSHLGGRSGNRGKCAQPCRLPYELLENGKKVKSGYLLSPKDIMTLSRLKDLVETGITSIKIEGRMKNAEYVAITTKQYRDKLDDLESVVSNESKKQLLSVFNRGGSFSSGYLAGRPDSEMMSTETPKSTGILVGRVLKYNKRTGFVDIQTRENLVPGDGIEIWTRQEPHTGTNISKASKAGHTVTINVKGDIHEGDLVYKSYNKQVADYAKSLYVKDERKIAISGQIKAKASEPLKLTLSYADITVSAEGDLVQKAENKALSSEEIVQRFSKTGNTTFSVSFDDHLIDDDIYISIGELNALRREATDLLTEKISASYRREPIAIVLPSRKEIVSVDKVLTVLVRNQEQFKGVLVEGVQRIYVEYSRDCLENLADYASKCQEYDIELFVALPAIMKEPIDVSSLEDKQIDGYLVRTYGQLLLLSDTTKQKVLDYRFNVLNGLSENVLGCFADSVTLSTELTLAEIQSFATEKSELVVYGNLPLMTTQACPIGLYTDKCQRASHSYALKDRTDAKFPILTNCESCIAYIYNSRPLFTLHKAEDILHTPVRFLRLEFTTESYADTAEIVCGYYDRFVEDDDWSVPILLDKLDKNFTNGHFYRGV